MTIVWILSYLCPLLLGMQVRDSLDRIHDWRVNRAVTKATSENVTLHFDESVSTEVARPIDYVGTQGS